MSRRKTMGRKSSRRKTMRGRTMRGKTMRRKTMRRKTMRRKTMRRMSSRRKGRNKYTGGGVLGLSLSANKNKYKKRALDCEGTYGHALEILHRHGKMKELMAKISPRR